MELWQPTVTGLQQAYRSRACSPRDVVEALLERIARHDAALGGLPRALDAPPGPRRAP